MPYLSAVSGFFLLFVALDLSAFFVELRYEIIKEKFVAVSRLARSFQCALLDILVTALFHNSDYLESFVHILACAENAVVCHEASIAAFHCGNRTVFKLLGAGQTVCAYSAFSADEFFHLLAHNGQRYSCRRKYRTIKRM